MRKSAELALAAGVAALGAGGAIVTAGLPGEGGYAGIGPNFIPGVIAAGLIVLGLWLGWEAWTGRWRIAPEEPFDAPAFLWVSGALFAHMVLIGFAGFVLAGAVLFTGVARGFGSRRAARDAAVGLVLSLAIFFFFVKLLNVNLPAGWLSPLLGGAGL
ncbi:MAG TPA: tripartite tricarboxylate transporter TctB family protein [Burkholderiales bacterium]|nr:tripartite tricarboxylate transporter TctB family protein [Burkholderiales bacterium]